MNDTQPTGIFQVINNSLGTLSKAAESYAEVRNAAKGENIVTPAPAVATPAGTTPGITPPDAVIAAKNGPGPVAGMSTQTMLMIGGAALFAGLLLVALVRRK